MSEKITASTSTPLSTLKDLRDYLNSKTDEQLSQPVKFWGEGKADTIVSIAELHEDFFNPSGDGCEPVGVYINDPEYKDILEYEPITYVAGTIILETNDVSGSITYNQ